MSTSQQWSVQGYKLVDVTRMHMMFDLVIDVHQSVPCQGAEACLNVWMGGFAGGRGHSRPFPAHDESPRQACMSHSAVPPSRLHSKRPCRVSQGGGGGITFFHHTQQPRISVTVWPNECWFYQRKLSRTVVQHAKQKVMDAIMIPLQRFECH